MQPLAGNSLEGSGGIARAAHLVHIVAYAGVHTRKGAVGSGAARQEGRTEGHEEVDVVPSVLVAVVGIEGRGDAVLAGAGAGPLAGFEDVFLQHLHDGVQVVGLLLGVEVGVAWAVGRLGQRVAEVAVLHVHLVGSQVCGEIVAIEIADVVNGVAVGVEHHVLVVALEADGHLLVEGAGIGVRVVDGLAEVEIVDGFLARRGGLRLYVAHSVDGFQGLDEVISGLLLLGRLDDFVHGVVFGAACEHDASQEQDSHEAVYVYCFHTVCHV